jgi:outer membrane lipoprotein carrier protein
MRLQYFIGLFLLLFLSTFSALARESQELLELLNPIQTLQGNFVQTILDNKGKAVQRSEGKMALHRPGRFRWEVVSPIPQIIVANSTRLWIYDPDLQQVVIRPVAKTLGQTPAFLLTNVVQALDEDFIIKKMPAPKDWQWFSLVPKDPNSMFQTIQLGFQNHEIKKMRMQDSLGHSTVIEFKQTKANVDLPNNLFVFRLPANVDVIDETHS